MGNGVDLRFVVDEDVPRSTARVLREAGYDAVDVRDVGLRGKDDLDIYVFAQEEKRIILSCDLGFSNILVFPPAKHQGVIVVRIPDEVPIPQFNEEVLRAVKEI